MLTLKLRIVDEELASGRWKTKLSKSHGRVVYLSLRDEKARYLKSFVHCYSTSKHHSDALICLEGCWVTLPGPICSLKIMMRPKCSTGILLSPVFINIRWLVSPKVAVFIYPDF